MGSNFYINKVEEIVKKLLPKFVENYETRHKFELPKIEVMSIDGSVRNIWKVFSDENITPEFGYVSVKVSIDVKDGRLGRVKKLLSSLVEKVMDSLSYSYDEIYIDFIRVADLEKEKMEKVEGLIYRLLLQNRKHQGWYSLPYSDSYDEGVDWIVEYIVDDVKVNTNINKKELGVDDNCVYRAEVTLLVKSIMVGSDENDEWEKAYRIHDLPEHSWDEIIEENQKTIIQMMPQVCDVEVKFKFETK